MTGAELIELAEEFERYCAEYDGVFGRAEPRAHLRCFGRGQLGPLERKSLEPIADAAGVPPRCLQQWFSQTAWDLDLLRRLLQEKVARKYGSPDGVLVVDETSDAKKGTWTAGVARQYCGESGKVDNCIVSVHVAYAHAGFHALLDGELFLPESWHPNPDDPEVTRRRRKAALPDEVGHESKAALALRQLRRARAQGVPARWVTADEGYGGKPWWRHAVATEGWWYVTEVPVSTRGWSAEPGAQVSHSAVEWIAEHDPRWQAEDWEAFRVHDTAKGPEAWEVRARRFWEHGANAPATAQWLLVARDVLSGTRKYFLSNAPEDTSRAELLRVAFSRWHIERCFQDCKTELGLNHAELRTYGGLTRHLLLTAVNYFFLVDQVLLAGGKKEGPAGSDGQSGRGCLAAVA